MTPAERKPMLRRGLAKAIRASGRAHAKVAAASRRPATDWRSLHRLAKVADRPYLAQGRVAGFALNLAAEERRT
jgi:hypothetical protein